MATIRLNTITKPREVNKTRETVITGTTKDAHVYTDIHLDLELQKNVGMGAHPKSSGDIKVDNDYDAIKNSIRNIFNTRKGQKLLTPEFGSSLDQFLFERVDDFVANVIGNTILTNLQMFEPRIGVDKVQVRPKPDDNRYDILVHYRFLKLKTKHVVNLSVTNNGQIIV